MRGVRSAFLFGALTALLAAGCGGGEERQDANEPEGRWTVEVVEADFPSQQKLAEQVSLRLRVRNAGDRTMPNMAVTVDGFSRRSDRAGLDDPNRPVWIIDDAPRGGVTAYTNTWALGGVRAGETKEFVWRVTPVQHGRHEIQYRVAAGLHGKARAVTDDGGRPDGRFSVFVSRQPSQARVDPDTGNVVRR